MAMFLLSWTSAVSLQPESLAPAQLEPGHPGRLCLSTATNIRTVTCNVGCNSNQASTTSKTTLALTLTTQPSPFTLTTHNSTLNLP